MRYSSPPPPTRLDASTTESSCASATPAARRSARSDEHGPDGASACDRAAWSRLNRYFGTIVGDEPAVDERRQDERLVPQLLEHARLGRRRTVTVSVRCPSCRSRCPLRTSRALWAPGTRPIDASTIRRASTRPAGPNVPRGAGVDRRSPVVRAADRSGSRGPAGTRPAVGLAREVLRPFGAREVASGEPARGALPRARADVEDGSDALERAEDDLRAARGRRWPNSCRRS